MTNSSEHVNYSGKRVLGPLTALSVVIANMIGTGIFTTTGFLAKDLGHPLTILIAWLVGGLVALCGALTYAELGVRMPRSGGEYHYLSRLFHPMAGFLAGWISLIVGFSAPVAAVAVAFSRYLGSVVPELPVVLSSLALVLAFSLVHLWNVKFGGYVQNVITWLKVLLILALIIGGFILAPGDSSSLSIADFKPADIINPAFAAGLIFVMYAYSGWNAAAYLGGEIKNPSRNLPLALISGTVIVTGLYLALNFFYLTAVPMEAISGKVEVGHYVAKAIFGTEGGVLISLLIAVFLMSTLSSMVMAGPRIYQVVGEDYPLFKMLAKKTRGGAPYIAIILQMIIAMVLILTFSFETILVYVGFTLSLFAGLAVAGIFVLRRKQGNKESYRTWGYPLTPIIFLLIMGWMIVHTLITKPLASVAGLGTLALGVVIYLISRKKR
ncbi:MAG: amino acid permease [Bacteroidales bacterium]|nr:amino acid permease [Bacteroidales bacterium]MCF8334105.1 amino acid permease [Bacteroidales bacterium]